MRHTISIFFSYLIKVSIFLFISNIAISQRVQLRNLERYLGKPIPERIGYVGVTDTMGDQRYMKLDSLVKLVADSVYAGGIVIEEFYISNDTIYVRITGDTKKNAKLPPGFTDTDDQIIDTVYFHDDSLYIKIEGDPRTWQVEINPMDNDVYVDSVYYKDNVDSLFLRVHKGSLSMTDTTLKVKIPDTDTQTLYRVSDSLGITRGNKIAITDLLADADNYVDTLFFVLNTRTLTAGRTGALSDLSVIIPDRDSQYFAISGTNSLIVDLVNGTGAGGSFTINTSGIITGSRSGSVFTLSATEVDGSVTNELQSPSWGSILSTSANLVLSINNSTTAINTVGITLSGNASSLTFTANDQSATNEAQTLTNTGTTSVTSTLNQISGVGGGSITHQTTTGISLSHSSNIATWSVNDKDSTNEIQTIDTFIVKQTTKGDSIYLSLTKDNQPYKSVFINKHLDSVWFNNTTDTLYLRVRDTILKVRIPDDQAISDNDNYVDTIYNGTNDTIIVGRTGSLPDIKFKIQDDQYLDTIQIVSNHLRISVFNDGRAYHDIDLTPYLDNSFQTIDTFTIVGNALRLSLSGDGQPFKTVDLSPFLDNTDNQVIDTFALVGNVIRLSISGDNQAYKSIDLSGFIPAGTNLTWVQGSNTMNSSTGTGTQINGFGANVNILAGLGDKDSQLGTAGQLMVTTGSQVDWQNLVGGSGISISGTTVTNTSTLGVGAGGATSSTLTTLASGQTPVTINVGGIITISESTNTNGGSITLSAIESQTLSIVGQNLSISGGNTVTLPYYAYSDPDPSPTNELQNLSWLSISATKAIQGISSGIADTIHTSSTSGIIFSQQNQSLFIKAVDTSFTNEGRIGVGAGDPTSSTITSNTTGQNAITVNAAGIISISETTNTNGGIITLNATEVDGDTTNELQYLRPYIVGGDTLGFISGITKDTVSFYGDTTGLGSGGGGGAAQVFSHAGSNYLLSTLSDGGGSIRINAGTQIQVTPSISGINGIATIKTDFNGCPECVGFFGFNAGNTNDSIKTDPLFKYWYDEGMPTLEVPTVMLTQTNQYSNPVALYISQNTDERVFTSSVDASGFTSGNFYHKVISNGVTISLPSGHTGASTHYFINDQGFSFTLSRSGSETIDGLTSQTFTSNDKLVTVANDGAGKWVTSKTASSSGNISYGIGPASPPQSIGTTTVSDIQNSTSPSIPAGRYMVRVNIKAQSWGVDEGYSLSLTAVTGAVTLNIGKWQVHNCVGTTISLPQFGIGSPTANTGISCNSNSIILGECDITVTATSTIKVQLGVETSGRAANIWSGTVELFKIG